MVSSSTKTKRERGHGARHKAISKPNNSKSREYSDNMEPQDATWRYRSSSSSSASSATASSVQKDYQMVNLQHRLFPRAMAWQIQHAQAKDQEATPSYRQESSLSSNNVELLRKVGKYLHAPGASLPSVSKLSTHGPSSNPRSTALFHAPQQMSQDPSSRKRQRPSTIMETTPEPAKSVPLKKPGGCSAKRCSVDGCDKIAVSKHLCRGHGGGRRCQFAGCGKCAQSRSPFCWAHGGGKRCEAPGCRRSRKTKRFCVDHVEMEHIELRTESPMASSSDNDVDMDQRPVFAPFSHHHQNSSNSIGSMPSPLPAPARLPSLEQILKRVLATTTIPSQM